MLYNQVYHRLNHVGICLSYNGTLKLIDEVSKLHSVPLTQWIADGVVFKFWGDNVDKKRGVRDVRSDHQKSMVHMYSILAGRSRTPAPHLSDQGNVADLAGLFYTEFLPTQHDVERVTSNMVVIVSRILTEYISDLAPLSKAVIKHIPHKYSAEMSKKSEVVVLDVLMKNEAKHSDMIDILKQMVGYLGDDYPHEKRVASGGDQLTTERQVGAQRHVMCGNRPEDRLDVLEPQTEDWHCLVVLLTVSNYKNLFYIHGIINSYTIVILIVGDLEDFVQTFFTRPRYTWLFSEFAE